MLLQKFEIALTKYKFINYEKKLIFRRDFSPDGSG